MICKSEKYVPKIDIIIKFVKKNLFKKNYFDYDLKFTSILSISITIQIHISTTLFAYNMNERWKIILFYETLGKQFSLKKYVFSSAAVYTVCHYARLGQNFGFIFFYLFGIMISYRLLFGKFATVFSSFIRWVVRHTICVNILKIKFQCE